MKSDIVKTYLIKSNISPYRKIGKSKDVDARINQIKGSMNFVKLELEHVINADCEKELHNRFSSKRISGEWFYLSDEDVLFIKSIESQPYKDDFDPRAGLIESDNGILCFQEHSSVDIFRTLIGLSHSAKKLLYYVVGRIDEDNLFDIPIIHACRTLGLKSSNRIKVSLSELIEASIIHKTGRGNYEIFVSPIFFINSFGYYFEGEDCYIKTSLNRNENFIYWLNYVLKNTTKDRGS